MSRYTLGFVIGGAALAAGCVVGLMLAPASGTEVRRRLAWKLDEHRHTIARTVERLRARAQLRCAEAAARHPAA